MSEEELEAADRLVEALSVDALEGEEFRDHFREAVEAVVEAKREHHALPEAPLPQQPAPPLDLMATLNASVEQATASRGEPAGAKPRKKAAEKKPMTRRPDST